jgi:hypothetical protein
VREILTLNQPSEGANPLLAQCTCVLSGKAVAGVFVTMAPHVGNHPLTAKDDVK